MLSAFVITLCLVSASAGHAETNRTIIELWEDAKAPDRVELQGIQIAPAKTAFLILDIEERTCNLKRRPRCISSVAAIKAFLDRAKKK